MKEKLHSDVVRIGTGQFDHMDIKPLEAVAISLVTILSVTIGTMYGVVLF